MARLGDTMIKHAASHLDHNLTPEQVAFVLETFADRTAFFITTIELPAELGAVPCGLCGPIMGDEPVYAPWGQRAGRAWRSRLIDAPTRPTRQITVIGGPHEDHPCVLYTVYGGPLAAQEPEDPGCKDQLASQEFWAAHALAMGPGDRSHVHLSDVTG